MTRLLDDLLRDADEAEAGAIKHFFLKEPVVRRLYEELERESPVTASLMLYSFVAGFNTGRVKMLDEIARRTPPKPGLVDYMVDLGIEQFKDTFQYKGNEYEITITINETNQIIH